MYNFDDNRMQLIINKDSMPAIKSMTELMPGGFFIYHADGNEEFILVNNAVIRFAGCKSVDEFKEFTGNSFKGFVHSDDLEKVEQSIKNQLSENEFALDYVEYRVRNRDGKELWIADYGHYVETDDFGPIYYVFISDATDKHMQEVNQKEKLLIERNRFKGVLLNEAAFYFEFDLNDGYIREDFRISEKYRPFFDEGIPLPIGYDALFSYRIEKYEIELLNEDDRKYWTLDGLFEAYRMGQQIVEVEYYSKVTRYFWKADILLSESLDGKSIHAVYVCRDVTKKKNIERRNFTYQKMIMKFLSKYSDVAAAINFTTSTFEIFAANGDYNGPLKGSFETLFNIEKERILPECREEFARNMLCIDDKMHESDDVTKYSFQTFFENEDGELLRKRYSFYTVDDKKEYILGVREDTTESYRKEQKIARIKDNVSAFQLPQSNFIKDMIHKNYNKHRVLVVEDSDINRGIIERILRDNYDVIPAMNGEEGLNILSEQADDIDLVLLDVYMPICNGFEFLERIKDDEQLSSVPIVVITGSDKHEDEERCLSLGAADFITKPFNAESLLSRISNIISLNESISTLSAVEFDMLTGLYTLPAFYYHSQSRLDQESGQFDIAILNIREFGMINSIHGHRLGDSVLLSISKELKEILPNSILSRNGDKFYAMIPAYMRESDDVVTERLERISLKSPVSNLRLKIGLCRNIDSSVSIATLCDRARMASESIADSSKVIAVYDKKMEDKKKKDQYLLTSFPRAIKNGEFSIWLQPKVDLASGEIRAAEALVRWVNDKGEFMSPGCFVPLFERDGCIKELDEYIFRKVCKYQFERKIKDERVIPISVNLSRNSLFSEGIVERYRNIVEEVGIETSMVPIEITESAATSDKLILNLCNEFVDAGFNLNMDDFGTGYSSLSSLSMLPFSEIKIDKSFTDKIGTPKGNIVVKNIVDTVRDLGMNVVAEGVENRDQIEFLSMIDCNLIQGFYYSKPLPVSEFEELSAKEAAFRDKSIGNKIDTKSVTRLTVSDMRRYLRVCKGLFSCVRLLDEDCLGYMVVDENGNLTEHSDVCHEVWNRCKRCGNCTSQKAMKSKKTEHKFEVFENDIYLIFSRYVEVDGKSHVVELINTVTKDMLEGYQENSAFLKAVDAVLEALRG